MSHHRMENSNAHAFGSSDNAWTNVAGDIASEQIDARRQSVMPVDPSVGMALPPEATAAIAKGISSAWDETKQDITSSVQAIKEHPLKALAATGIAAAEVGGLILAPAATLAVDGAALVAGCVTPYGQQGAFTGGALGAIAGAAAGGSPESAILGGALGAGVGALAGDAMSQQYAPGYAPGYNPGYAPVEAPPPVVMAPVMPVYPNYGYGYGYPVPGMMPGGLMLNFGFGGRR